MLPIAESYLAIQMVFTIQEHVQNCEFFFYKKQQQSLSFCSQLQWNASGWTTNTSYNLSVVWKFGETGSLQNQEHKPVRVVPDEATVLAVLVHAALIEKTQSIKNIPQLFGVDNNRHFLHNTGSSNESTLFLTRHVKQHNCGY